MRDGVFHYEQRVLENELVALHPFDPPKHAAPFLEAIKVNPQVFAYVAFPEVETEQDLLTKFCSPIAANPAACLYMVIDKVAEREGRSKYAGVVILKGTDPANAVTEVGILIFPAFQRSHVTSNAIGLMLCYLLDPPSAGGLGLRRVEWKCHSNHEQSQKTALRMGFVFEGITRWASVWLGDMGLPIEALEKRNGTEGELPGRHTAGYSIVWDEWGQKRPQVVAQMERKA